MQVNVHEAKSQLSKLLERVENGEKVTIARDGKPVAELVPVQKKPFPFGIARNRPLVNDEDPRFWDPMTGDEVEAWIDGKWPLREKAAKK